MSFKISCRVFYEDTDAAGVVYHANYLKFAERARTEWLRSLGFSQHKLMLEDEVVFPVYELSIKYIKPAHLDDLLDISVDIVEIKSVTMKISQKISCESRLLATLEVFIASCNLDKKPIRFPSSLLEKIKKT
jgi:acyl-CoA thioester hydrolase